MNEKVAVRSRVPAVEFTVTVVSNRKEMTIHSTL
jgi:hypothetical protein